MLDKFNFYDLLGSWIPGGVAFLLTFWFAPLLLGLPIPKLHLDLGQSLLLVGVSYVIGHLLAALGEIHEDWSNGRRDRVSERILRAKDRFYSENYKTAIKDRAHEAFGFRRDEVSDKELFQLCWSLLTQKSADSHTQIYLAISGLSRAMMVIS